MLKSKNVIKFIFVGLLVALFALLPFLKTGLFYTAAESKDLAATNDAIVVTPQAREGVDDFSSSGSGTINDSMTVDTYLWSKTSHFTISVDPAKLNQITPIEGKYEYQISVEYWQKKAKINENTQLLSQGDTKSLTTEKLSADDLSQISVDYYIDETDNKFSFDNGWGIYRFEININNNGSINSKFFFIEPTPTETLKNAEAPDIKVTPYIPNDTTSSKNYQAFKFEITNTSNAYKYMDQSLIRWFVYGVSREGEKYCYHKDDVGTNDFKVEDGYSVDRTLAKADISRADIKGAKTFDLQTGSKGGQWHVYCVIYEESPSNANIDEIKQIFNTRENAKYVENGEEMQTSYIIIIIVAAAVVLVAGLIVIIVLSIKKEKVW